MNVGCIKRDACQREVIMGCDECSWTLCQRCSITWCEFQGSEHEVCQKRYVEGWFRTPEDVPVKEVKN